MSLQDFEETVHREWIRQARLQSDDVGEPLLAADYFPGYEIQREIHRGAQGAVFRAVQKGTGRRVALKLLHDHAFGGPMDRARFEREMHVLGTIQHPNIVAIHDGGSHNGRFFLVMDYIAGQPLDLYMASQQRSIRETLELFITICEAVNAAHVRGIIHRDLKPANVRVDASGRPFVLDFGLAKITSQAPDPAGPSASASTTVDLRTEPNNFTITGQFLGSLPWAAPEQAEGSPTRIDVRTDVYSLGVLLYHMLTGKFPYPVVGPMKRVLESILHDPPASPRALRPEIDDELETIALKCLSKERERRYQSAGELARDVRRYLTGEPIEAKRDSAWYMFHKTVRRYRFPLAIVGLFVLLLGASTVVAWTLSVRARDAAQAAGRAETSARDSEKLAQRRLHESLIAQARSTRRTGQAGQRFEALDAIRRAAAIAPTLELRSEAIAAMALLDLRLRKRLKQPGTSTFDRTLERCAVVTEQGAATIVRTADDVELAHIPPVACGLKELHSTALTDRFLARIFDPIEGDRRLEVWDFANERLHFEFTDVPRKARFAISPDGLRLAVGRLDQAIHVYDLETQSEVQRIPLDRPASSYLTFDPSGRRLALYHGSFSDAQVLDLETGRIEPAFGDAPISWDVAWHPDGKLLAGAFGSRVELWDVDARCSRGVLSAHEASVVQIRFSHDGTLLASYSWDGITLLWDTRSWRPLLQFPLAKTVFSLNDRLIAGTTTEIGRGLRIEISELEGTLERRRLIGSGNADSAAYGRGAFDPLGELLFLTDAVAVPNGRLRVFGVDHGAELAQFDGQSLGPLAVDPRGQFVLAGDERGVLRWNIRRDGDRVVIGPPQPFFDGDASETVDLSTDASVALIGSSSRREFGVRDMRPAGELRRYTKSSGLRPFLSPDGRWIATEKSRSEGGEVWDSRTGQRVAQFPPEHRAWPAFHPNGVWLVSSGDSGLSLWEVGTWQLLRQVPGAFGPVFFSRDGRVAATPIGPTLRLLDGLTFEVLATLEPPETYYSSECAFSPDGAMVAQFTNRAGVIHLWDLRRIRENLAGMGLDWNLPPYNPPRASTPASLRVAFEPVE